MTVDPTNPIDADRLADWAAGRLSPHESADLEAASARDPALARELARFARVRDALARFDTDAPASRADLSLILRAATERDRRRRWVLVATAAAAAVIAVGVVWLGPTEREPARPAASVERPVDAGPARQAQRERELRGPMLGDGTDGLAGRVIYLSPREEPFAQEPPGVRVPFIPRKRFPRLD